MKKILFYLLTLSTISGPIFAQVGIGTSTPSSSAQLDVNSTTRGFLPPRMTTIQRDAITSPADGLIIYNTTNNRLEIRSGSSWLTLVTQTGTETLTNKTISGSANTITNVPISSGVSGLGSNVATFLGTPTSANLASAVTNETGSGALVFGTSPTLTSPIIPMIIGGTGTTSNLVYRTTTGVGDTGADHIFQVGNNGTTEAMRIRNDGIVGIGTSSPSTSAQLDVNSTTKGFLPPRMTSAQRTAINTPAAGLMVYQTDGTAGLYYYSGSAWVYINNSSGTLAVANGGTGTTTSTGSGSVVLSSSPTLTTPTLGVATATSINKVTITAPANSATLTIADGKTLTANNSITLAGTDATTMTFPSSNATLASLAGTETLTNKTISGSANTITNVSLSTGVTGTLPIANGGTGQTTANAALNALLPSQTGNANRVLQTNGTNTSWATNVALTSAVIGTLNGTAANLACCTSTGSTIDLPPGKWSVQITMMAQVSASSMTGSYWLRTMLSTSNTTNVNDDAIGPKLVSGLVQGHSNGASKLNVISGTIIINNTSGSTKTYYYRTEFIDVYDGGSSSVTFFNFGKSTWAENSIVAYPMN